MTGRVYAASRQLAREARYDTLAWLVVGGFIVGSLLFLSDVTDERSKPRVDYPTCVANVVAAGAAPEVCEPLLTPAERDRLVRGNHAR